MLFIQIHLVTNLKSHMDPKTQTYNPVGFRLHKITTEQFALMPEQHDASSQEIGLSVSLKFGMSDDERLIAVFVKVQFENNGNTFLLAEIGHHYLIEPKAWEKLKTDDQKLTVPKMLASHLVVLAIGTLRGFIHAKTESISLNHLILPTVNVSEIVNSDIELT